MTDLRRGYCSRHVYEVVCKDESWCIILPNVGSAEEWLDARLPPPRRARSNQWPRLYAKALRRSLRRAGAGRRESKERTLFEPIILKRLPRVG